MAHCKPASPRPTAGGDPLSGVRRLAGRYAELVRAVVDDYRTDFETGAELPLARQETIR